MSAEADVAVHRASQPVLLGSLLFFASGFTGLAYEVLWFKRFAHVWGSSSLATAAVVGSFLLGLGLGAHFLGGLADRVKKPLVLYGAFELAIGLLALVIPHAIGLLSAFAGELYGSFAGRPLAHYFARLGLTFLVIGPPTVLMGATLPLMVRQFATAASGVRGSAGWLYAVNTLGAATGCYVTGFHLLSRFGLGGTNWIMACANLAIGAAALLLARDLRPAEAEREAPADAREPTSLAGRSHAVLYAVSALTGFTALVLQIVWVRQLSLVLGGTTYAFTAVLFVVLIGIGAGSALFRRLSASARLELLPVFALPVLIAATVIGQVLLEPLTLSVAGVVVRRASESYNACVCVAASAALELVPALVMGMLFPYLVHLTRRGVAQAGVAVGRIYATNTLGTILGASLCGVLIVPWVGTTGAVELALVGYGVALVALWPLASPGARLVAPLIAAALVAGALLVVRAPDPRITNGGGYKYGVTMTRSIQAEDTILMFEEGPMTSVLVTEHQGRVYLRVDGKVDATSEGDMGTQLGLAYFPRFLRPEARDVLVIGYGSGSTAGASTLFHDTRVVCCEIEPAVYAANRFFAHVNHDPPRRPNFEIVLDDGRSYLQAIDREFDLIISEPSNPWMPGIANLFTREYYESARAKLAPGGLVAQWVQVYDFELGEYALIARTLTSVFPHVALVRVHAQDTILLASEQPLALSPELVTRAQALVASNPAVQQDLQRTFGTVDVRALFLQHWFLDEPGLARLIARDPRQDLNTDGNMRLAFDAPRRIFREPLSTAPPDIDRNIVAVADVEAFAERFRALGCGAGQLAALVPVLQSLREYGRSDAAQELAERLLALTPDTARSERVLVSIAARPLGDDATWRALESLPLETATQVGSRLRELRVFDAALAVFERLVRRHPDSGETWAHMALNLHWLGRWSEGDAAWKRALALEPGRADFEQGYRSFVDARQRAGG
jgi:predicted membrane-bound spermidine synthase